MTVGRRLSLERKTRLLSVALLGAVATLAGHTTTASAEAPSWHITSEVAPTNLPPGGEGEIIVAAGDLGDVPVEGGKSQVTITDVLPPGVKALAVSGQLKKGSELTCSKLEPPVPPLTCTYTGALNPYERLAMTIRVKIEVPPGTVTSLPNEVTVEGGGAAQASSTQELLVNGSPIRFGVQGYELSPLNEGGTSATQAGSQPFQLTTTLVTNQTAARLPVALPKDLSFNLPAGLIGNPNTVTQCSEVDFAALVDETNLCPASTVVGAATVVAWEPIAKLVTKTVPVFNLVPAQGEPARFGFEVIGKIPIVIDTAVRSGRDYGVLATVRNATETAGLLSSQVTLWGDPGDPRHNNSRGWECVAGGEFSKQAGKPCPATSQEPERPFLRNPTSCEANPASEPVTSSVSADSWAEPGNYVSSEYTWTGVSGEALGFSGCEALSFSPQIDVAPESQGQATHTAATPTGLTVKVMVPQGALQEPEKLAQADVRDSTVTLPPGVELSPSAANGLQACSEAQVGYEGPGQGGMLGFSNEKASCPDASKLGSVHIKTPLLSHELEGSVYLATPAPNGEAGNNPFNSLIALYLVAEDPRSGVLVKLAGEGHVDQGTLRVSTSFSNTPQVPFEELRLELFPGPRASVSTPALCGSYATEALFTPWSGNGPVSVSSPAEEFKLSEGPGGSSCPITQPFAPGFLAESLNPVAGAFTRFALELSRPDGDQDLRGVSMQLPGGMAAMLSSVTLCTEGQANAVACPASSEVGKASALSGLGPEPFLVQGGRVYITGPYGGAPFGLEIVTPAVAGPFDLGNVEVRSKIFVNPNDASITILSDPLPTQLKGIPLQLGRVLVSVDRPGFEFNPTNCSPMEIKGSINGSEGTTAAVASPFRAEDCAALPFAPKLTAVAGGHGSKANGTSLAVTVTSGGVGPSGVAQAGIAKVDLALPVALSSRLSTLQKACAEAIFNANPASCNEASVIGYATIHTPVLSNPLSGPAYLVSHGGAAFPDVEFVLQGEGITLLLDGKTDIKAGVTYSRFESAPDAPFTVFETVLPAGPHGVLTPNVPEREEYSLCKTSLQMPTEITGQNGAVINETTTIAASGCGSVLSTKTKLTRAQALAKALAACHKRYKHSKAKRRACERQARQRYAAKASKKHAPEKKQPQRAGRVTMSLELARRAGQHGQRTRTGVL